MPGPSIGYGAPPAGRSPVGVLSARATRQGFRPALGTYVAEVQADTPVVYWRLGEPSGVFVDTMVGNDATATGTPTRDVPNPLLAVDDGGVSFPTVAAYLTAADSADLDLGDGPFTLEVLASRSSDSGGDENLFSKGIGAYQMAVLAADDTIGLAADGVAVLFKSSTTVPADGSWHHYVITREAAGDGKTRVYVDGVDRTVAVTPATALVNTATALYIGASTGGGAQHWTGGLDEIAIYGSVLSAVRVADHYAALFTVLPQGANLFRTADEALGLGDSATKVWAGFRIVAENVGLADAVVRTAATTRSAAEAVGLADVASRATAGSRTTNESIGLADAAARAVATTRTVAQPIGLADVAARVATLARSAAESIGLADAAVGLRTQVRTAAEAIGLADAATRAVALARTTTETLGLADAAVNAKVLFLTVAESIGLADAATRAASYLRSVAQAIGLADSASRAVSGSRTATEAVGLADAASRSTAVTRTAAESLSLADVAARTVVLARAASDALGLTEAATRTIGTVRTASQALGLSDAASRAVGTTRAAAESIGLSAVASRILTLFRTAAEAIGLTDSAGQIREVVSGPPPIGHGYVVIARGTASSAGPDGTAGVAGPTATAGIPGPTGVAVAVRPEVR